MDTSTGVAGQYLANPAGRNVHGHGPTHTGADHGLGHMMSQFAGLSLGGMGMPNNSAPLPLGPGHFMVGSDGQFVLAPMPAAQPMGMSHSQEHPYNSYPMPTGGYGPPYVGLPMPLMPYTPGRANTTQPRVERGNSDVPGLENRRGSYSTTESTPATPFYGAMSQRDGPRVASLDRSAYTTPSPQQMGLTSLHGEAAKSAIPTVSDSHIDDLLKKDPAIPRAVPAVFTPPGQMKSLEQSLENRIPGNRNVYIRGLHPTTDDRLLYEFAARFGPVETSKAIIDTNTGACKGFGFAKFVHVHDSESCIRGFHRLGYEVGFARESFNSRLKAEGDECSTNLYISNLPKSLTEVELATIFLGYTILSSKILRDSMGNSRGVGFARFESRDVCDEIIRKFNGVSIGEEALLMNIRYADTPAQKELKRVTAERRQFRTNEYNIGAYGTPLVGMSPTLYGQQSQTVVSSSSDANVSTPNSSECDEGVTIHADPTVAAAVADESVHSSPPMKKDSSKNEATAEAA
ncbi:sporulation-specific protein [Purpureocillium lavendulum]|uniref:Sporulation-specific protein n=1 Tax=Purpureocillium lavendulum TaxID=1247861 RepID=A0AB34G6N2_9HYPO|nr:sporulation-specific protein [Purpureocillium lavendulum]